MESYRDDANRTRLMLDALNSNADVSKISK